MKHKKKPEEDIVLVEEITVTVPDTEKHTEEPREGDNLDIEWGETNQERIVERSSRSGSDRHRCKGPNCDTAFDKY